MNSSKRDRLVTDGAFRFLCLLLNRSELDRLSQTASTLHETGVRADGVVVPAEVSEIAGRLAAIARAYAGASYHITG